MVRSPLEIIIEIFLLIFINSIQTLLMLLKLLGELFYSLAWTARTSIGGLILATIIGGLFLVFLWKYLFRETVSLAKIILAYAGFMIALFIVLYVFFSLFH
jgi:hypothetical protein